MSLGARIKTSLEQVKSLDFIADDCVCWSGPEVLALANRLQTTVQNNTLPGSRIGISFPNSAVQAVAILACLMGDRVPVIFNYSDVSADLIGWLDRSKLSFLLTSANMQEKIDRLNGDVPPYLTLTSTGTTENFHPTKQLEKWLGNLTHQPPKGTALIIFTSGSTGEPKGIFVPSEGLLKTADYLIKYFKLSSATVAPAILPVCHSLTLNTHFIPTILAGGRCFFVDTPLDFKNIYRIILRQKATFISLIGEILVTCSDEMIRRSLPQANHVEHLQLAGGLITERHLQYAKEMFPNATIHKGYGLTEAIRVSMINSHQANFLTSSVGSPLPFVSVEVRDDAGTVLTNPEDVGEIFVKGPNVCLGTSSDLTLPIGPDSYLATGDLGCWNSNGQICIAGRKDSVFKLNGHRISGIEIEKVALRLSNVIKNARCLLMEDDAKLRSKIVLLLEVPNDLQKELSADFAQDLYDKMWQKFEAMTYFPREVLLLTQFPRTSNGKLSLNKMKDLYLDSARKSLLIKTQNNLQIFKIEERMMP